MNFELFGRQLPPPSFTPPQNNGDDDTATQSELTTKKTSAVTAPPRLAAPAVSVPSQPLHNSFLPDLSNYDLTVSEALDVFSAEQRRRPSDRTMQRYCQDGRFDCYKLKTTRNGKPIHEWIINGASLRKFIQTKPVDAKPEDLAPPCSDGDASKTQTAENDSNIMATSKSDGDVSRPLVLTRTDEVNRNDIATPEVHSDANGGTRSKVELMIENAEMVARLEAKEELVIELREDKNFLREELTHKRQNDSLIADTYGQVLDTLKAVSVAGRHTKIEIPDANSTGDSDNFFNVDDVTDQTKNNQSDGV